MFNLEDYVKNTLIDLYDKKVYIGAKVRELALNYMIKGVITQETVVAIDEYITNAEAVVEEIPVEDEVIEGEIIEEMPVEEEIPVEEEMTEGEIIEEIPTEEEVM